MKMNKKIVLAMTTAMLLSAVSMPAYGKVISYTSGSSSSVSTISKNGPGYSIAQTLEEILEDETEFDGPVIKKVSLYETYHELYDTYEESIADTYFLYTNVANGGMTHEPVTIDIPANVIYTMEKDGAPYSYVTGGSIREKGTYVLRLTAIENPELPFSEQTEYQAVFRFRIQDAPAVAETTEDTRVGSNENSSTGSIWNNSSVKLEPSEPLVDISTLISGDGVTAQTEAVEATKETVEVEVQIETTAEAPIEQTEEQPSKDSDMESVDAETESIQETSAAAAVRTQDYDAETGFYTIVLENGMKLMINVEDGYKGSGPVQFAVDAEDLTMTALYRGSDRITLNNNSKTITESGKYTLAMADDAGNISSIHFTIPYQMNIYGILAIVLSVLVIGGIITFVVVTKKNLKIR